MLRNHSSFSIKAMSLVNENGKANLSLALKFLVQYGLKLNAAKTLMIMFENKNFRMRVLNALDVGIGC